jgi:histidine decarboxylase
MITVSSFCGLAGAVWGYDVVRPAGGFEPHPLIPTGFVRQGRTTVPVYSASPLLGASRALFGTVTGKRFPLLPGAHVPCAGRHIEMAGPCHAYAAFGIAIARDRARDANLIMEDVGIIPLTEREAGDGQAYKAMILEKVAQSVLVIGENQGVEYSEILLELKDTPVAQGQIGSALIAAPYFTLARQAVPSGGADNLRTLTLDEWEHEMWPDSAERPRNRSLHFVERREYRIETSAP